LGRQSGKSLLGRFQGLAMNSFALKIEMPLEGFEIMCQRESEAVAAIEARLRRCIIQ